MLMRSLRMICLVLDSTFVATVAFGAQRAAGEGQDERNVYDLKCPEEHVPAGLLVILSPHI